jgi:hypothetical protein
MLVILQVLSVSMVLMCVVIAGLWFVLNRSVNRIVELAKQVEALRAFARPRRSDTSPPVLASKRYAASYRRVLKGPGLIVDIYPSPDFSPKPNLDSLRDAFMGGLLSEQCGVLVTRERVMFGTGSAGNLQRVLGTQTTDEFLLRLVPESDDEFMEAVHQRLRELAVGGRRREESLPSKLTIEVLLEALEKSVTKSFSLSEHE